MKGKWLNVSLSLCLSVCLSVSFYLSFCLSVCLYVCFCQVSVKFPMEGAEALTKKISAQKDVYESDDKLYKLHMKGKCLFIFMSVCLSFCLSVNPCVPLSLSFWLKKTFMSWTISCTSFTWKVNVSLSVRRIVLSIILFVLLSPCVSLCLSLCLSFSYISPLA